MFGSATVFSIIDSNERASFKAKATRLLEQQLGMMEGLLDREDATSLEEVDLHWRVAYATTDVGTANSPAIKPIALDLSAVGNVAIQTQDPKVNGNAVNSPDQVVGIFGIGVQLDQAALTVPNVRTILQDLSTSKLRARNGTQRRFEVFLTSAVGCGPDVLTDAAAAAGRLPSNDIKCRKLHAPFVLGANQKFELEHIIGTRTAAWPAAFTLDFWAPALTLRKK